MSNPFRSAPMKQAFDEMLSAYERRARLLFFPDGTRCVGNGAAVNFWRGFDGSMAGQWDRASKETYAYAHWRAGREAAKRRNASLPGGLAANEAIDGQAGSRMSG